jgi:hypothetical protein
MKVPVNFMSRLNGQVFTEKGFEFLVEVINDNQVWIFGGTDVDFKNCILLSYDWPKGEFDVRICQIGNGTQGYTVENNLELYRDEIISLQKYIEKLKQITCFHFDKIIKPI